MGTTFADAAERLGMLRPESIRAALLEDQARGARLQVEEEGMVETAIRRIAADRRVVLRQGERVAPGQKLILAHDPDNPRSERLRALRTEILLLHEPGAERISLCRGQPGRGRGPIAALRRIGDLIRTVRTAHTARRRRYAQAAAARAVRLIQPTRTVASPSRTIERPYYHPGDGAAFHALADRGSHSAESVGAAVRRPVQQPY